jgi:acetyltransferase EpsM
LTDHVQPLLILGTHRFAPEVLDLVSDVGDYRVDGFVENIDRERTRRPIAGLPVYWIDDLAQFAGSHLAVCALGTTKRRRLIDEADERGVGFASIVHPTARVSRTSTIGEGTVVSAGVVIAAHVTIGRHVILNRGALIGHDTVIGDYVTIGPGANIAGICALGDGVYVGIGAVILDRITVGSGSVVGAGAVVTRDVPEHVEVVGVPARIVKEGIEGR